MHACVRVRACVMIFLDNFFPVAVNRGRGSVLPAAAGSMPGLMSSHSSSPMMPGFVTAPPMSVDQVMSQVAMPQSMTVAQMQVDPESTSIPRIELFWFTAK